MPTESDRVNGRRQGGGVTLTVIGAFWTTIFVGLALLACAGEHDPDDGPAPPIQEGSPGTENDDAHLEDAAIDAGLQRVTSPTR